MDKWSKDERAQFKKFWEGEIGKKYLKRLKETKKQLLNASMGARTPDEAFRFSMIGNGFQSVIEDIDMMQKEPEEKEDAAKKK